MQLEPWVTSCVLFDWWYSPLGAEQALVGSYCCSSYGGASSFDFCGLSLAPTLGTLSSIQWLAERIHLCICQVLAKPLRRHLFQVLGTTPRLVDIQYRVWVWDCIWDWFPGGAVFRWFFLLSLFHTLPPMGIFFILLRTKRKVSILWSSFSLSFIWSVNCFLGIQIFSANVHLSESGYIRVLLWLGYLTQDDIF